MITYIVNYLNIIDEENSDTGVIGSDVPWLDCSSSNANVTFGVCVYRFGGLIDPCSALGVVYNVSLWWSWRHVPDGRGMCVPPSDERVGCRFTSWCGLDLDRPVSYVGMKYRT